MARTLSRQSGRVASAQSRPARRCGTMTSAEGGSLTHRELATLLGISVLLIVPCLWQPRIQAGDLSSHLYNAWLASEIRHGHIDGFEIVPVWTNVLTDWILMAAVPSVGAVWAGRLVAVPAVLI